MRALVVDDEEDICDFLKHMLEDLGFETEYVLAGEEALRLIQAKEWQLVLVDLKLPSGVTGLHLIDAIRRQWPKTVIAAMSGYVDVGLRQETEKLGVHDFLEKPDDINPDVFVPRIKALLPKIKNT
ncbi:MAG: response regulator [Candidatus Omnitrophica bacterium]|nr:response regulator [Candidatus Omnitrophota bacterium]